VLLGILGGEEVVLQDTQARKHGKRVARMDLEETPPKVANCIFSFLPPSTLQVSQNKGGQ